jgi:O-antigen/teichoic acid export membrane protein
VNIAARRVGWGFVDQALSSGSNFALSAFVAATVSATAFGAFTIIYGVYNLVGGFSAGLASVPLVVTYSAASTERFRAAARSAVGSALVVGVLGGIVCLAVSPFLTAAVAGPLRVLGVVFPGLLVQDAWRYCFVTGGHPEKAAANDSVWTGLQLLGSGLLLATGSVTTLSMVLLWGGSATVAAALGCWQAKLLPAPQQVLAWLGEQQRLTWRYAAEAVVHRSGAWVALALVGAVAGLKVVGALRGAILLVTGPLNLVLVGATFAFAAEGVRLLHRSPEQLPRAINRLNVAATGAAVAWCTIVLLLPGAFGARVLGATWHQAQPLLPIFAVYMIALSASLAPNQGMMALGAARRSLFTQVSGLAVQLPAMVIGAVLAGAWGAALAMVLTTVFRTLLGWIQFRRGLNERVASAPVLAAEQAVTVG